MTRSIVAFVKLLGTAGLTSVAKKLFSVVEATIPEIQKSHEKEACDVAGACDSVSGTYEDNRGGAFAMILKTEIAGIGVEF